VVGGYSVDPAELQHGCAVLGETVVRARAGLDPLRGAAAALLPAGWQGSAASAFRLGWEQWVEGVLGMLAALDEMAVALGGSGAGYAGTDEAVRTSVTAVAT
jgi:WXG100 family type VII secretion target